MTAEGRWVSIGQVEQIDAPGEIDRIPDFDPRSGAHLWIMALAYQVDPLQLSRATADGGLPILDHETLLSVAGPGCYYCERPFTSLLASRRCPGRPQ